MTVAELIKELEKVKEPNLEIMIYTDDQDVYPVERMYKISAERNGWDNKKAIVLK